MATLTIPCVQPWSAPTIRDLRDRVHVIVGTERDVREYDLSADALKERSGEFRKKLSGGHHGARRRPRIELPDENPAVFDAFATWLSRGTVGQGNNSYLRLCHLYTFTMRHDVPLMRNTVIDAFLAAIYRSETMPYDVTKYLEHEARDSALRNMIIDVILPCGNKEKVDEWEVSLAKGFFQIGFHAPVPLVPFEMEGDVRGFIEQQMKDHVCDRYHEHPSGNQLARSDHFFADPPPQGQGGEGFTRL
ncbi:hypothetical protein N0V83_008071 [Neocucurbitaria cava]|uniref:BTB domain-containing protein n=1 Tax=Neocucurbitaria cava TaxID=798079 RepID=A0A9W9CK10_9PLEO|nr:hypothetical protein N0V83_008071 [Neocucurbitaria cava]